MTIASLGQLGGRLAAAMMGAALAAILGRSLGAGRFGVYSLLLAIVSMGQNISDVGTTQIAVRDMAAHPEQEGNIAAALIAGQTVAGMVIAPVLLLLTFVLVRDDGYRLAGVILLAVLPLGGIGELQAVSQAQFRPGVATSMMLTQSASWLASAALLAWMHASLSLYAVAFVGSVLLQFAVLVALTRNSIQLVWSGWPHRAVVLYRTGVPLGLAGFCVLAYYKIDGILLFTYKGAVATGTYAAGYKFLDVLQFVPATIIGVLTPLMGGLWAGRGTARQRREVPRLAFGAIFGSATLIAVGGLVLSRPIIRLVYGSAFAQAAHLLAVLILAFPAICLGWLYGSLLIAGRHLRPYVVVTVAAAVANVVANVLLLPKYGAVAAAWTTVGTEWFVVIGLAISAARQIGVVPPLQRCVGCIAAGGSAAVAGLWLRRLGLLPAGAAIVGVFAITAGLLRVITGRELRALLAAKPVIDG